VSLDVAGFALLAGALTLSPGPATILVIGNAARGGFAAGVGTTAGVCLALLLHATLSALGLSAVVATSARLFSAVKLVGAAYLVWLGLQSLLRSRRRASEAGLGLDPPRGAIPAGVAVRQGFLSNVLNPNTALFYLAILPQFAVVPERVVIDSLTLAGVHFVIAFAWLTLASAFVGRARSLLARPRAWQAVDLLLGSALLGFGVRLALARR
jgi:threonine/homoserine/homoserine lactone efflux protein